MELTFIIKITKIFFIKITYEHMAIPPKMNEMFLSILPVFPPRAIDIPWVATQGTYASAKIICGVMIKK